MKKRRRINPDTIVMLKHIAIGAAVMLGVALLVTSIWYGTRVQFLTIQEVQVEGGQTIDTFKIQAYIQEVLEGHYLGLVPRKFAWFYPESEILEIVGAVERVHDVKIEVFKGTKLRVTFDEYLPVALWCESVSANDCLFLDNKGYAFGRAPELSGGTLIRFVTTDRSVQVGEELVLQEIYDSSFKLSDLLSEKGWFVSHVELDQVGDMFLKIVGGGELKVVAKEDPSSVVDNLMVILSSKEFSHLEPGNFKYIDLRFGSKVFVKEKDAVPEVEAANVASSSESLEV